METIDVNNAKTHFAKLLDRVAKGKTITITRHGVPVATLQPVDSSHKTSVREVIGQLKRFRSGNRLDGFSLREMIEDGIRSS